MLNPLAPLLTTVRAWHHRRRYPALPATSATEVNTWWDIYYAIKGTAISNSRFETLAIISNLAWRRLHRFCREHDIERGHTPWHRFDAPGCINVWSIDELHPRRWGELLYAYHASALCAEDPMTVIDGYLQGERRENELVALLSTPSMVGSSPAIVLSVMMEHMRPPESYEISQARHFLSKLYTHAVGHPLPPYQCPYPRTGTHERN